MKKLTLLLLIAMVPFLTMAQKRGKKKDKTSTEQTNNAASVEYMMIKGVEVPINESIADGEDMRAMALGSISSENVKLIVAFDYGDLRNTEVKEHRGKRFRTMMSAVNSAAEKGWEFINSNVIVEDKITIHYYYMRRNKNRSR